MTLKNDWLYAAGIFLLITFSFNPLALLYFFVSPLEALLTLSSLVLFGFIAALFSTYLLTPLAMRGLKPFYDAPPEILESLKNLSRKAGLKKPPKLMVAETPEVNAVAYTSISGNRVGITRGLLNAYQCGELNKEDLEAILAHEIGHHKGYDCLKSAFVFSFVSIVDALGYFFTLFGKGIAGFGLVVGFTSSEDRGAGLVALLFGVVMAILGYIMRLNAKIVSILALHYNRRKEYAADALAAMLTSPQAMANALKNIENLNNRLLAETIATLPFSDKWQIKPRNQSWVDRLFSTHPPIEKRIEALLSIEVGGDKK